MRIEGWSPRTDDKKKSAVVCLVERDGRARAFPVERVTSDNMQRTIREVGKGPHVMTDESNVYHATGMSYEHDTVGAARPRIPAGFCERRGTVEGSG